MVLSNNMRHLRDVFCPNPFKFVSEKERERDREKRDKQKRDRVRYIERGRYIDRVPYFH